MSETLRRVREMVSNGKVEASRHGYRELAEDGILLDHLRRSIDDAVVVEDYPHYAKGPCVLVLQSDEAGEPVHALWGLRAGGRSRPC